LTSSRKTLPGDVRLMNKLQIEINNGNYHNAERETVLDSIPIVSI